jgi:hypothetical protein
MFLTLFDKSVHPLDSFSVRREATLDRFDSGQLFCRGVLASNAICHRWFPSESWRRDRLGSVHCRVILTLGTFVNGQFLDNL